MKRDSGQTLVEAAIVVPMLVCVFLCMLQVMVLAHARVLLEYAAFNAARAGVVNNANPTTMRQAGLLSMLPVWGNVTPDATHPGLENFSALWLECEAFSVLPWGVGSLSGELEGALGNLLNVSLTGAIPRLALFDATPTNPPQDSAAFKYSPSGDEIDLDLPSRINPDGSPFDTNALDDTRLTIEATAIVPMKIPVGNRLVFYAWIIGRDVVAPQWRNDFQQWVVQNFTTGMTMEEVVQAAPVPTNVVTLLGAGSFAAMTNEVLTYVAVTQIATRTNHYLFPLRTSVSMPMESNIYKDNLP